MSGATLSAEPIEARRSSAGGRAAGAVTASAVPRVVATAVVRLHRLGRRAPGRRNQPDPAASSRAENSLPGERHWWIKHAGAPDAIQGFTGQASVPRGDPVTLFVSTTAREFRVTALRMGWYGGLLARRVWHSGWVRAGTCSGAIRCPPGPRP